MVYKNSYFNKELKEAYIVESVSRRNSFIYGCLYIVATMALHLVLNTLSDTVVFEWFPEIMIPSNFSVMFLYNYVALFLFIVYLIANYRYLTFQEVGDNRWYVLVKNGYSVNKMVTAKLLARFFRVFTVYSVGYVGCLLLCSIMGYQLVIHYLFSLYFVGFTDILVIYMISLTISNFIKKSRYMGWVILLVFIFIRVVQKLTGYYDGVRNRELMKNFSSLFTAPQLFYVLLSALIFIACLIVTYAVVKNKAVKFSVTKIRDVKYYMDYKSNKVETLRSRQINAVKMTNVIVTSVIAVLVVLLLGLNVAVLLMTDFGGLDQVATKPILFQTNTMEPLIKNSDLAFFDKVTSYYQPKVGDVVLFDFENKEYAEMIIGQNPDGKYVVDITNYTDGIEQGYYVKTIEKSAIKRVFISSNRALGALVTFSRTTFGRIVLLVVPLLLIVYRKEIVRAFVKRHPTYADSVDSDILQDKNKII